MTVATIEATDSGYAWGEGWAFAGECVGTTYQKVHDGTVGNANCGGYFESIAPTNGDWCFVVGQDFVPDGAIPGWYVYRGLLAFDLSALPAGAVISAVTLSLYGVNDYSDTDFDILVVSGADLGVTFVPADYIDLLDDTVSRGSMNTVNFVAEAYNAVTLNATGIAEVQAGLASQVVRFGLRSSRDISSTTPKLNGAQAWESVGIYYHLTANKKPKLTITYGGLTGEGMGVFSVVETAIHYVDKTGVERFFIGQPVV